MSSIHSDTDWRLLPPGTQSWGVGHQVGHLEARLSKAMTGSFISASGQLPPGESSGEVITWGSVLEVMVLEASEKIVQLLIFPIILYRGLGPGA